MPRQADPATPEELAERIAKLPAWARKHIEAREELIRVLGGQLSEKQHPVAQQQESADGLGVRYADFYSVHYGAEPGTSGAKVLVVETDGDMIIRPVKRGVVYIARG